MAIITANNQSMTAITSLSGVTVGNLVLLSTETASSDSTIDFTSNIDSTYKEYIFKYYDLNPETDRTSFVFNLTTDGTNFNVTKTTTNIEDYHFENDTATALGYRTDLDLAQSTSDQTLMVGVGNGSDESGAGTLHLYDPSNTTFVKHFISDDHFLEGQDIAFRSFTAGYANTTSAVTGIRFKMASGDFDGTIKMYGVV
jgi:hypothetical protein|tara:strand:+ start:361 stop:957 length:597 start_codon:yes stop_codon:yes gene_type:complete